MVFYANDNHCEYNTSLWKVTLYLWTVEKWANRYPANQAGTTIVQRKADFINRIAIYVSLSLSFVLSQHKLSSTLLIDSVWNLSLFSTLAISCLILTHTHARARAHSNVHTVLDFLFHLFVHSFYRLGKKTFFFVYCLIGSIKLA